jgi:hypothetical protein
MTVANGSPSSGWTVTGQTQTTQVNDAGVVVQGVRVQFRTGNGTAGYVFVPMAQYTPDQVRMAIAAQAAVVDQVDALAGQAGS